MAKYETLIERNDVDALLRIIEDNAVVTGMRILERYHIESIDEYGYVIKVWTGLEYEREIDEDRGR